ncbi:DNA replication ATP-dependent helicase/nuclease DNA2 isoform X2 [Planococcus citri]|uniref:DNA replication ATP-dependent helicase/nuclease DNA2 isoform X2 n=1 Tax=Planococcus citri TaxID=170843 RepID=UPI0031F8DE84
MSSGKSKAKLSKQCDTNRQTSIRSFFSSNFRKTIAAESNSRNAPLSKLGKAVIEKKYEKQALLENEVTACKKNTENSRPVLSTNYNCVSSGSSFDKSQSCVSASEKRKYETDDVLADLLGELENSSPEDYNYLQSLAPSKKIVNTPRKSETELDTKRPKLSPSLLKNEIAEITNGTNSRNEPLRVKVKVNKRRESNKIPPANSPAMKKSSEQSHSDSEVPKCLVDIENLADLLNSDCDDWLASTCDLNLNEWTYCKVNSVQYSAIGLTLTLQKAAKPSETVGSSTTTCVLRGCWLDTPVKEGDVVCVKAHFDPKNNHWLVNNERGFITVHPDVLITGTGIVGSLFCQRRSVLSYIFPSFDPPNVSMIVGSLVHELLQEVLRKEIHTLDGIQQVVDNLVSSKRTLYSAYECDVAVTVIRSQLEEFSPKIFSFVNTYMKGSNSSNDSKTWSGEILQILSIEENFWIPQLGIKGKTDVVLKARKNDKIKILPLELKTGRASNSSEHRGQVILYLIMMSEIGTDVDAGLLFYLRENKITEINPKHAERSGLMCMRNGLVNYIVTNETPIQISETEFKLPDLPEPINHHNGCAKCPYLTVCSASLSKQHRESLSKSNPLNELSVQALTHLTDSHIRYVFFWLGLLKLEEWERKKNRTFDISDLWHVKVAEREARGYCVSNLRLQSADVLGSRFLHKMRRISNDGDVRALNNCSLIEGDYVVVSKGRRYAIASGYVDTIEERDIFLKLDRMLEKDDKECYVVDKYSMFDGLLGFNTSSLLLLFENTAPAYNLRSVIIDSVIPSFTSQVACSVQDHSILRTLNETQKNAILNTLRADHYTLIKGMPGTGKTATVVALVKLLVSLNYSVLITSHTHSAVDNILLRLKDSEVDFLRLGSYVRVHDSLKNYCEDHVLEKHNFKTVEDLENFYNKKQVIAVTCMGCSHVVFRKRRFDYCIVDEATQVLQPSVIKPLFCSKKFVLIGDPDQLPPVVQSKKASLLGLSESLFKKLDRSPVTSVLNLQYRMNSQIMQLANSFAYENALECANELVSSATIVSNPSKINSQVPDWMKLVLSNNLDHSIILLDTSNMKTASPISEYSNQNEADITFSIVHNLNEVFDKNHDVGIIAPFREQVKLLRNMAPAECPIEINTVDQYQGRDKDVIIYSCTKASSAADVGILSDKRRLTVAITRAKRKLILIANVTVLRTYAVFDELFSFIPKTNIVQVTGM